MKKVILGCLWVMGVAWGQGEVVYEHRVVTPTTAWDTEAEVEGSLERNVNRLAALGFEVGAFVGGNGEMLDRLLERKAYVGGQVDHAGQVFVIMHRAVNRPAAAREYRLLHTRLALGVDKIVAGYGQAGFRLTATAWEGGVFHAAFERVGGGAEVEYRVFRTERRRGWPARMLEDAEVRGRVRRVVPMTLDSGLVELGAAGEPAAEFVWESDAPHNRARLEERLNKRAAAGFRVQVVRLRNNELDVGMLKPAGAQGAGPALDLDDGPWGGPCGRGRIAGADIWTDGDVYCVAEDPRGGVSNRGFDMVVAPAGRLGGRLFFGREDCGVLARLKSNRAAAVRVALAWQLEKEIERQVVKGYRVTRAFAGVREDGEQRLVVMATKGDAVEAKGVGAARGQAPVLAAELDGFGQQTLARTEAEINERLAGELKEWGAEAWAEIQDERGARQVTLLGCVDTRAERERAETVLDRLLVRTTFSGYRIRNEIIVQLGR